MANTLKWLIICLCLFIPIRIFNTGIDSFLFQNSIPAIIGIKNISHSLSEYFYYNYLLYFRKVDALIAINEKLYDKIQHYRDINAKLDAAKLQIAILEDRLKFVNLRFIPIVTTSGYAINKSNGYEIYIPAGSSHDVRVGDIAIYDKYLAGVVVHVSKNYSFISTPYSSNVNVPVVISKFAYYDILTGVQGRYMYLKYYDSNIINKGDIVVTSGRGGLYPPGLIVGAVSSTYAGDVMVESIIKKYEWNTFQIVRNADKFV